VLVPCHTFLCQIPGNILGGYAAKTPPPDHPDHQNPVGRPRWGLGNDCDRWLSIFCPSCPPFIGRKILDFCVQHRTTRTIIIASTLPGQTTRCTPRVAIESPLKGIPPRGSNRTHATNKNFPGVLLWGTAHGTGYCPRSTPRTPQARNKVKVSCYLPPPRRIPS
jgi:hypothetical protein